MTTIDLQDFNAEDGGILDCWIDNAGDKWLYVTGYESWYQWTGTHWTRDEGLCLQRQLQDLLSDMNRGAITTLAALPKPRRGEDPDAGKRAHTAAMIGATKRTKARVASIEGMAQAHRVKAADKLDKGNTLNFSNGTLNLDTLELHPHEPDDMLTYVLPYEYDPTATAPRWKEFVHEVLVHEKEVDDDSDWQADTELIELLQEAVGYSLTTDTCHETMFWISGEGNSGKSTILRVLRELIGGLSLTVNLATLGRPGNYTVARVPGKRILQCAESRKGAGFNEELVRKLVSGHSDMVEDARTIYGKPFDFHSVSKLWWAMNDLPAIKDTSNAIWRRLRLLPFNRTFTEAERDVQLVDKLIAELPGILVWALEGLQRLRARGRFAEPAATVEAKEEYRLAANTVQQWLEECTKKPVKEGEGTTAAACLQSFTTWAQANQYEAKNKNEFALELAKLVKRYPRSSQGVRYALVLREKDEQGEFWSN